MTIIQTETAQNLRSRAENKVHMDETVNPETPSPADTRKLLHELQVHQIELELQNDELCRTQAELETERSRYFNLYDLAPVGYLTISDKGPIREANLTAATMLGLVRNDLIKRPMTHFIYTGDQYIFYQHSKLLIEKGESPGFDIRLVRANGSPFWAHLQLVPALGGECWIAFNDITERKRRDIALQETNASLEERTNELRKTSRRLNSIVKGTNAGTWEWNVQTGETEYNERWAEIIGYTLEEISPVSIETWRKFSHPDDLKSSDELLEKHFGGELDYYECESRMKHKEGNWVWVIDRGKVAAWTKDGKPLLMSGSHQDITERKQAEEELRKSQTLLNGIINGTTDAIYAKDLQGRYILVNSATEKLSGNKAVDMLGRDDYSAFPAAKAASLIEIDRTVVAGGKVVTYEDDIPCVSGVNTFLITKGPLVDECGNTIGVFGIARDITALKLSESVLEARLRLMCYADSHSIDELLQATLDEAEALTGSQIGFYHFVNPDQLNLTLQAWSTNTSKQMCKTESSERHYPVNKAGVWVDCIRERKAVIHNDYASLTHCKGLPEGHAQVVRELVVPVLRGDAIVAILGVGNRPTDYSQRDIETITSLSDFAWDIVQKKQADDALKERMKELACLYNIISLLSLPDISIDEILMKTVMLIPPGWQFPEITEAYIALNGHSYQTPRFLETPWMQISDITAHGKQIGQMKVCYLEERRASDEGPFLIEERHLLNAIAEKLGLSYGLKQAEIELQESNSRFDQLAIQNGTIVWEIDSKGLLTYISHVSEAVFGYRPDEVVGKMHFYDMHPESVREAFKEKAFGIMGRKESLLNVIHSVQAKDGHIVWVSTNGIPILSADGTMLGYRGSDTDITENRKLKEQLLQAQKMEAVGQLAGGLAHDFNNILGVISGYCCLMQLDMGQDDSQKENIGHIVAATKRAAELTQSMLAFSRTQLLNTKIQSLNLIVAKVGIFINRVIGEDIHFRTISNGTPLTVNVDGGQIEQVLINLATNARDAMPNGGELTITTDFLYMDDIFIAENGFGEPGPYAIITVSDTGEGMDEATKNKIFEPFFTTKDVGKGTGLGLAMVYGIISQHGGFADVCSYPGHGTSFLLYLPMVEPEDGNNSEEISSDVEVSTGTEMILIVEDNAELREAMSKILAKLGYRILFAVDGQDAVEKFKENADNIQLIIMDMIMPKMNGKLAYDEIRQIKPDARAIFCSGYSAQIVKRQGELGENAKFLSKPVQPAELMKMVREMLDR